MKRRTFIASAVAAMLPPVNAESLFVPGCVQLEPGGRWVPIEAYQRQAFAEFMAKRIDQITARHAGGDLGTLYGGCIRFIGFDPGIASGDRTVFVEMVDGHFVHYADPGDDIERVLMEDGHFVHYREDL